jgi:hypothetical protein
MLILIFVCCFVASFSTNVFLSATFPVILDGKYSSFIVSIGYSRQELVVGNNFKSLFALCVLS